jgi:hypothetical protein
VTGCIVTRAIGRMPLRVACALVVHLVCLPSNLARMMKRKEGGARRKASLRVVTRLAIDNTHTHPPI